MSVVKLMLHTSHLVKYIIIIITIITIIFNIMY